MRCLYCYEESDQRYHKACIKKFFNTSKIPKFAYSRKDIETIAKETITQRITVPGVQPKISLHLSKEEANRFTIVGFEGDFILKIQNTSYPEMPENEDLTMHMAELCDIPSVPHTLLQLTSGEYAYLTKRIDRNNTHKIHMEDMCQVLGFLSENKYKGSMEKIGKAIQTHSSRKGLDLLTFFEITLFSYLTGNSDMHLKNFSFIESDQGYVLAPAYDLLNVKIINPKDTEELALQMQGKKKNLKKKHFLAFAKQLGLTEKQIENSFTKFNNKKEELEILIQKSFLSKEMKINYVNLLEKRYKTLNK